MQTVSRTKFTTVKTEGAILPADLLQRVADGRDLDGLKPTDYHLAPNERLNEAINRSWNRCLGVWQGFDDQRERLPAGDAGTTLTRERWLLILFQELGYGRLPYEGSLPMAPEEDAPRYPISHRWSHAPIHLVTFRQDLDRRDTSNKRSPHSLMQEFLNRSDESLWGLLSNGLRLRVLRDNVSLTRAAYVEFDLEAMMAGELYADFALLWLVCHQSRVEGDPPGECWLERWSKAAAEQGVRALDALRDGVQEAIVALGRGFLAHRANSGLKASLQSGELGTQDYYRQLLRLVYRLIFLFVAEERGLLLQPGTPDEIQRRYTDFYSVRRLRDMAETLRGGPHADLYRGLRLVLTLLRDGYTPLGLPALGSFLFSARATPDLDDAELANSGLLGAVRALAFTIEGKVRRPVDYRNLGAEELGSVYESLLELDPQLNADAAAFDLHVAAGSERKTTGSYYTPSSLIRSLLDSALEPVVEDRLSKTGREVEAREAALLDIKVVDPACGSGHFLIAAAHRLARHLARVRTGDDEPAPAELRDALRDVVRMCIHGVDINPMAVELCKVALWMETLDPGKPLSFLERNIQCGNSLIATTPALLKAGIADEAFNAITGDDKAYCTEFKKKNRQERSGQLNLLKPDLQPWDRLGNLAAGMMDLDALPDDTLEGVRRQQEMYESLVRSSDYRYGRMWADAWCAAFVWRKTNEFPYPITEGVFRNIERNPFNVAKWMQGEIERLWEEYQFFHWHLAFPHVFSVPAAGEEAENKQTGWNGGFDVVLGNPPWETSDLMKVEFFEFRVPEVLTARTTEERKLVIEKAIGQNPLLDLEWQQAIRKSAGESHIIKSSGLLPLTAKGKLNTYRSFAELSSICVSLRGRVGIVVKSGIVNAQDNQPFFSSLVRTARVVSITDFINTKPIFPDVVGNERFCLFVITGLLGEVSQASFLFGLEDTNESRVPERLVTLSAADLSILNPNDLSVPPLTSQRDMELLLSIHRRFHVLMNESTGVNPFGCRYSRGHLNSSTDSRLFSQNTYEGLEQIGAIDTTGRVDASYRPLVEGKLIGMTNHRFGTFAGVPAKRRFGKKAQTRAPSSTELTDAHFETTPRFWLTEEDSKRLFERKQWDCGWMLAYRHVCRAIVDARTTQICICPLNPASDSCTLLFFDLSPSDASAAASVITTAWSSFVGDYVVRQKLYGPALTKAIVQQLPVPMIEDLQDSPVCNWEFVFPRFLELAYTAWDLQAFAQDCGYDGAPFRWDEERRFLLRCELDAAYFHLYGIVRDDVDYIMETFPIVKRKDEAAHVEYRTKRVILETYDAMQHAIQTGQPYQTLLDPPPADPRVAHRAREASS